MTKETITLAQGGGGSASSRLISEAIVSRFGGNTPLAGLPDAALLPGNLLFSTDSFVVTPRFFPGGNIGKLAVCGTVNDLLVSGGVPQYLSLALVIEEGFPREELHKILDSVRDTAREAKVQIATGDTKVVPAGHVEGIVINTSGIGTLRENCRLGRRYLHAGDRILVSGNLGDHGMAVLGARHGITGNGILSDCALLTPFVETAFACAGTELKLMRDPTRGGTGAVIAELLEGTPFGAHLQEAAFPVAKGTRTLAEMTGIDPLFVPCEGRVVAIVGESAASAVLEAWHKLPGGENAAEIGVLDESGVVTLCGAWGGVHHMVLPENDPLPRIC